MTVNRFDTYKVDGSYERTDEGFLRVPVYATRTGVFKYRLPDGTIRRELRTPEEVFKADSMRTLAGKPFTNRHPAELLTKDNVKKYMVGAVGDRVEREDEHIATNVTIHDADMIDEVEKKGLREVSCGYVCDLKKETGIYMGEHYDAVQTNIKYNHLAGVPKGRAGATVRLRMDSEDAELVTKGESDPSNRLDNTNGGITMTKVKVGGVEYEASETLAAAITQEQARNDQALAEAKDELKTKETGFQKKLDESQAKIDQLNEENEQFKKDAKDVDVKALVKARTTLISSASKHVDEDTAAKFDEMDESEIKIAVIKSKSEKFDAEGKSEDYINARFDAIMETDPEPKKTQTTNVGDDPLSNALRNKAKMDGDGKEKDADTIRKDSMQSSTQAWQMPLSHSINQKTA